MASASGVAPPVVSGTTPLPTSSSSSGSLSSTTGSTLAGNFQTFLTLLTTQLKNQNPLDPLDTNQFTQQLVQFAGVEQQLKTNDQLSTMVSLQQTAQATQALGFVGKTAVVDGSTTALTNGSAAWNLSVPTNSNVSISITNSTGQTVFSGSYSVKAGQNQTFGWDGKGNDGTQWPDGKYTLTATAADTAGNSVAVSTQIQGVVNSVDLTQSPPLLSINGQTYTVNQIKSIAQESGDSRQANFGFAASGAG
jgi:flagellar basal-body rod modification protein FlgD